MSLDGRMQRKGRGRRRVMPPSVAPKILTTHAKIRRASWRRALRKSQGRYPW
jgi:hypothetical protein